MSIALSRRNPALPASCATHIVQDGLASTIFVLLPVLAQAFGLTYAQVGLLKGLNSASQAIFEFASGWIAERIGEARLLVVGLGLAGAGYLALAAAPDVVMIAACLLLVGAGSALHHAPSSSLIANSYELGKRSSALGIYNASGDVGKLLFTGCFSLGAGMGLAWFEVSLAYGVIALAAGLAIGIAARSFLRQPKRDRQDDAETGDETAGSGWGILNWRSFTVLLAVTSIDTVVQTGVFVFVAFLMLSKGVPLAIATVATVILLAGGVFGKAGCGFLADRMGARQAFILIQVLTAIGLVGIVLAPTWLALVLLVPLGAVAQGSTSITYGFAANLIHRDRMARGYALLYSSGTLAAVAGPLVFGWVADTSGIGNAFYVMVLFVVASIPPMLMLRVDADAPVTGA